MTLIRVNPASVRGYGTAAQGEFDAIATELTRLADDVVSVRYFGPNSVAFKRDCGRMAEEFGRSLHRSMGAMADAVRVSTSNIAASLGGAPVDIHLVDKAVVAPAPSVVDYVDVDTSALEALLPVVDGHFTSIRDALQRHLDALRRTDWEGNAKLNAVTRVQSLTSNAAAAGDEARVGLTSFIRDQIDRVVLADA
jgi:hypothetical protein